MPSGYIKKIAAKKHVPVAKVEKWWKKAKEIAGKKFSEKDKPFYPFVTYLTKKMAGIPEATNHDFKSYFIFEQTIDDTLKEVTKEFKLDQSIVATDNILSINTGKLISNLANLGFVIKNLTQEKDNEILVTLETSWTPAPEKCPVEEALNHEIREDLPDEKRKDFTNVISIEPVKDDALNTQFVIKASKSYKFVIINNINAF